MQGRGSGEGVPGLKRKPLAGKSRKSSQRQKPFKAWNEQELMPNVDAECEGINQALCGRWRGGGDLSFRFCFR